MPRDYAQIIAEYDLPAMLWRLRDAKGPDYPPDLAEMQEILQFVKRLSAEQRKPVKRANVHRVTLFHDGHTVEILRRGSGHYGPSAQRQYHTSRRLYHAMMRLCHTHGAIVPHANHRDRTVYHVCEYVPQV
ncbi:MAG: hypothetical protein ACYTGS_12170 [Planctomycetota bacterium]|jgi:hypothetical protein